jgi:hypothetical protein
VSEFRQRPVEQGLLRSKTMNSSTLPAIKANVTRKTAFLNQEADIEARQDAAVTRRALRLQTADCCITRPARPGKLHTESERRKANMKGTELMVVNTMLITDAHFAGGEPPEFTYPGRRAPKKMPTALMDAWADFRTDCEDGLPRKFYALVLRSKAVRAVEISSLGDLAALTGPYFGYRTISFFDEQDEENGLGEAGDRWGGVCHLFIPDPGARIANDIVDGAIEGTKEYSYYIGPDGLVKNDPDERH